MTIGGSIVELHADPELPMLALLLLLQSVPADVIVTGKRLEEAQAACVRGGCTPLRDAQASIALAESMFRGGRYLDARRLLAAAAQRNRDHAATDPKPVAALYEALATVSLHEGDQDIYARAVAHRVRTLRDNLPAGDTAVVAATPALGDMWVKLGNYRQADAAYRAAERDATAAGQPTAALVATVKRIGLAAAMGRQRDALRMLAAAETLPAASDPELRAVLRVVRFRIAARDADDGEMAALAAALAREQGQAPALIWSPPYPTDAAAAANAEARKWGQSEVVQTGSADLSAVEWIDVGYRIRPDGRTDDVELLRGSAGHPWAGAVLAQVEGRRYAASTAGGSTAASLLGGVYKVERVTRRSHYVTPIGSLIRRRAPDGGFETLDLTTGDAGAQRTPA